MKIPLLTASHYLLLAGLIDGEPRQLQDLVRRVNWDRSNCTIYQEIRILALQGLVDEMHVHGKRGCKITSFGKEYYRETLDFYMNVAKAAAEDFPFEDFGKHYRIERKQHDRRRPTPDEQAAILAVAYEPHRSVFKTLWELNCTPTQVMTLNIDDVDVSSHEIYCPFFSEFSRITVGLAEQLEMLIDGRSTGPLFIGNGSGRRLKMHEVTSRFRNFRRKVGIEECVTLSGQISSKPPSVKKKRPCTADR